MEELNGNYNKEPLDLNGNVETTGLPTEISVWTKIKNFLFQDVVVDLTPKQAKVFQEVHDFWHMELTGTSVKNFLFKEIEIK